MYYNATGVSDCEKYLIKKYNDNNKDFKYVCILNDVIWLMNKDYQLDLSINSI
jgi:hypothetical protein